VREVTIHDNLEIRRGVATKKNPKQGTRLGVWSLLPHLGFWAWAAMIGDGVPPDLA
jgi:hypothetical protein